MSTLRKADLTNLVTDTMVVAQCFFSQFFHVAKVAIIQ
jgi:hypothetical protein